MNHKHPEIFQGFHQTHHYFEGWYFKFVTQDLLTSIAIIPGISIDPKDGHAFIQVFVAHHGDEPTLKTYYIKYLSTQFLPEKDRFFVKILNSIFSSSSVTLSIEDPSLSLQGHIDLENTTPLNQGFLNPSIMGPFSYLPKMECYHGLVSLNHQLKGSLVLNGETVDFTGGKGYIEKDWGTSFPEKYVWVQANHFQENDVSFFFSYATIPYLGLKFNGLISHLYIEGKHYRFATYNAARIVHEKVTKKTVEYTIKKGFYTFSFKGLIDKVVDLPSPKHGVMNQSIKEGLSGHVEFTLLHKKRIIYQGKSALAGIEIMK
jgi:tocopherol cyclase